MMSNLLLVLLTFVASTGFGVVFGVDRDCLVFAGLAGAATRVAFLTFQHFTDDRFLYTFFAAVVAAFIAEFLARWKKIPAVMFLYPAMVPLIPGDQLYYCVLYLVARLPEDAFHSMAAVLLGVGGIALGFTLAPMITHSAVYWERLTRKKARELVSDSYAGDDSDSDE